MQIPIFTDIIKKMESKRRIISLAKYYLGYECLRYYGKFIVG